MDQSARLGVISDTHGLLRPEAIDALRGVDFIVHAGDVGDATLLDQLRAIAPTVAVRGNVDVGAWAKALPETRIVHLGEFGLYVLHELSKLVVDPKAAGLAAVIYGHSHRPSAESKDGVLYLNPGGAGPRRFTLPLTVANLQVIDRRLSYEFVQLAV